MMFLGFLKRNLTVTSSVLREKAYVGFVHPQIEYSAAMGPLQLAVTWYKIRHAGKQAVYWDIQNKATSSR